MVSKSNNIKQDFINRASHLFVGLVVVGVAIVVKLVYVQFFDTYKGKNDEQALRWIDRMEGVKIKPDTLRAMRGNIYAVDGSLMATSVPKYEVGLDPTIADSADFAAQVDSLGLLLSRVFRDRTPGEYADMARDARAHKRQFLPLYTRHVSYAERQQMRQWPFFRRPVKQKPSLTPGKKVAKVISPRGGVFRPYYEREHPFGTMAERTLGDLDPKTGRGLRGLEASFQSQLAGKNAVGLVEVLSNGVKKPIHDGPDMRPEPGMDLHTTIDVNYQDMAEVSLRQYMEKFQADNGTVIVMEVQTGEIRAIANLTRFGQPDGSGQFFERLNYAVGVRTDPGSTFKLASMMALLEEKAVYPGKMVYPRGKAIIYRGIRIEDTGNGYDKLTAQQVFEKSSNVGTHLLMKDYFYARPDLFCQYLRRFRLTEPTGIHMKGEAPPFIRNPDMKGWSKTSVSFMSRGYEMLLTPLQMLTFYNAVANDGRWVRPMIVKQIRLAGELVEQFEPYVDPQPIASKETIRIAKKMLKGVVEHGTAHSIHTTNYGIAGKTGTAQKNVGGAFRKGLYYSSFIGYFPANKPRYTILAAINNPRYSSIDSLYGGKVAAPVFRAVADRIHAYDVQMHSALRQGKPQTAPKPKAGYAEDMHLISQELGLGQEPSVEGWVRTTENGTWKALPTREGRVPDVRGLPLRDALPLLENRGLRVAVRGQGRGRVAGQSLEPGAATKGNRSIVLTLE
ncbi:MAG: PASTA domain-containing protein [Cytophagales bacterium]|nr:MAG: PASTA domain-containing protein [Cytophagales bacterium]